jgi:outer membrane receptor protein involved in Fe transport
MNYKFINIPLSIRVNSGKKYRTPTFNDLFWSDWGDPNLKPEYGYAHEAGVQYSIIDKSNSLLTADFSVYQSTLHDMIMWAPNGAVWNPMNLAQANIQGFEIRLQHVYKSENLRVQNKVGFDINNSHIVEVYNTKENHLKGQQLYYVPKYSLNYFPTFTYKNWFWGTNFSYNSEKYFDALLLPIDDFFTIDAFVKLRAKTKNAQIQYSFNVKNITNTKYELIKSFPMPGRYYEFGIQLIFNK